MKIIGIDELNAKLHQMREELGNKDTGKVLYGSLMFAALPIYRQAQTNAPFRTGVIQGSIKRKRLTKGNSSYLDGAAVGIVVALKGSYKSRSNAYYYIFHEEYGARGRPAIPFMRPAFEQNKDEATNRFAEQLDKRIQKIMG